LVFTIADISGKWDSTEQWEAIFTTLQGNDINFFLGLLQKHWLKTLTFLNDNKTFFFFLCLTFFSQLTR